VGQLQLESLDFATAALVGADHLSLKRLAHGQPGLKRPSPFSTMSSLTFSTEYRGDD
jgi:hypothetical protein